MNANERSNHTEGQQSNNNKEKNKSAEVRSYTIDHRFSFERSCGNLEVTKYAPSDPSDLWCHDGSESNKSGLMNHSRAYTTQTSIQSDI